MRDESVALVEIRLSAVSVIRRTFEPPGRWDVARSDEADSRAARWEKEANDLSSQVAFLQEELALVRRKLTESPRHVRVVVYLRWIEPGCCGTFVGGGW